MESEIIYGDEDIISIVAVARRLVGADAAAVIQDRYAGTRIYVPEQVPADHHLAQLIGWGPARAIAAEIGGTKTDVPSGHSQMIVQMQRVIIWAGLAGRPVRAIAGLIARTEGHTRHIARGLRALGKIPQTRKSQRG